MELAAAGSLLIFLLFLLSVSLNSSTPSLRLIHRFSKEMLQIRNSTLLEKHSADYYGILFRSDYDRQRMKFNSLRSPLYPSEGSQTMSLGNDFGWLHYTWIDIGTPRASFLVALDTGSDLLWVPCDCQQCAPLSASNYNSLDRDLSEYIPSRSSTSQKMSCSHNLCESSSSCATLKQPCPYSVQYFSANTSTSGVLVEDILHLSSQQSSVQANVIIGCGMKQSGGYLDGVAPDGLMGLGLKETSVPSFLSRGGFIANSFSLCFDENDNGRIFFGDQGPQNQQSTSLLDLDGSYKTYVVGVEGICVGKICQSNLSFTSLVDSGTSFTFLPKSIFDKVAKEFNRQINASIATFDGYPFSFCYKTSSQNTGKIPSLKFMFSKNNTLSVLNPVFMIYGMKGILGFCLAIQSTDSEIGAIGQNFMTGYRMVYDRGNMRLAWSRSKCGNLDGNTMGTFNGTENPLPGYEQQSARAVAPAVAGRTPDKPSMAASDKALSCKKMIVVLLLVVIYL